TDGRLDVHAVGVTAARLLDEIGRQTGSKMALAQPSPAIATIHLEDMSLANALEVIARGYGLGVARIDGGYVLAPGWPTGGAAYSFSWQRTFQVQHLPAEVAAELLPNVLDRYIHVDREHNAIVATGSPALLEKIGADIAAVDKRPPLFRVEATMVDMGRTYDLAAELDVRFADGTTSLRSDSGAGDITFRVVSQPLGRIRAGLAALEERGMVETCAESNILARGGQYSWVFGGVQQFYPYRITQPEWRGRRQEITLRRTDVGVRLGVWPSTGEQGRTRCYVDLRASNILSVDSEGLPLVASREVRTLMRMAEHETIYVGGIELDQIETRRGKVPLLGDLPVLGRLFRSRRRVTTRRAVAIFLTVHVEGQEGGEHTAEADWPMPVAAQWEDGSDPHSVFEGSFDG
ncbi:MAG: type II secretion system protein GspD, partial [Armatimonadota bacterium]